MARVSSNAFLRTAERSRSSHPCTATARPIPPPPPDPRDSVTLTSTGARSWRAPRLRSPAHPPSPPLGMRLALEPARRPTSPSPSDWKPDPGVGQRVEVRWDSPPGWYAGTVVSAADTGRSGGRRQFFRKIHYDDGTTTVEQLGGRRTRPISSASPRLPTPAAAAAAAAAAPRGSRKPASSARTSHQPAAAAAAGGAAAAAAAAAPAPIYLPLGVTSAQRAVIESNLNGGTI
eukprot:COSAG04_NODE_1061_length_8505_cov_15.541042_4_plen_232_part_00